jgi:hypothetical protein
MTTESERNNRVASVLRELKGACVAPGMNHDYSCTDSESGDTFCCECGNLKPMTRADLYRAPKPPKG